MTKLWTALALTCCIGCGTPRVLAPRTAPSRELPHLTMPAQPPAAGYGRVIIDATDGAMNVTAQSIAPFVGAATQPLRVGPLCRTPCVVDLPLGRYTLYFSGLASDSTRGDVAQLEVYEGLNVLRRAPGKYETPEYLPGGPIVMLIVGTALLSAAPVIAVADEDAAPLAVTSGVVGTGLLIGAAATWPARATQQQGTSTEWREAAQARPVASAPSPAAPAAAPTVSVPLAPPVAPTAPATGPVPEVETP